MRSARLFAILDQLRLSRGPVPARLLADLTGVTERTIYRDMATLQAMGAPIRGEGGLGYQMEKGHFLPPLNFDPDELDAIALGMRLVAARGDEKLGDAAGRVAAKIDAVLPDKDRGEARQDRLIAYSPAAAAQHILGPLREAIRRRRKLDITYQDLQGRSSARRIRPLGLTAFDTLWLLTAWCEERADFRNFRLDRLESVTETGINFTPERGREFRDYLATL